MFIESNVELPAAFGRGRPPVYPFGDMEVGDSIVIDQENGMRARLAASARKRQHEGWDYTARKQPDGSVRIWRTA